MRLRWVVVLALSISHSGAALADAVSPGRSRVPHDLVIEIDSDVPGYHFWLVSRRGAETLDLAPGRPFLVSGGGRNGSHREAYIVAAPAELVEGIGMNELPPGAFRSEQIDFGTSVPFYDSRERVVTRYRLDFVPGQRVELIQTDENTGSKWIKRVWAATGVLVSFAVVGGGLWVGRRMVRTLRSRQAVARRAERK